MRQIETEDDIAEALAGLLRADPRLKPVVETAGTIPLRRRKADLAGLCGIVVSQQVSKASADAIFARVRDRIDLESHRELIDTPDEEMRGCGLSAPKIRTLRAIGTAIDSGALPLHALADLPPEEAIATLTAVKGIGPWTAEIYLLFCLGHPDIFPAGDLALQVAVAEAFGLEDRPKPGPLAEIARRWSPWRGVAARLFWAYYQACRGGRDAMPL